MSFENQIQTWVQLDNQIKQLSEKTKELREKRNLLEQSILSNNIIQNTNSIPISDGKLKITNTKVTEPLTFTYLEKSLGEIIQNETQIKIIMEHVKQKRNTKTIQEIKRFTNKE